MSTHPVLEVRDLHKTFRVGFLRKRVDVLRGVDFAVREGETFFQLIGSRADPVPNAGSR